MKLEIGKDFAFAASHILRGLPEGHQCGRLHGHNYGVTILLRGEPDELGMVYDYGLLKPVGAWIDDTLDHRHLNDLKEFAALNPTAENLAMIVVGRTAGIIKRRAKRLGGNGGSLAIGCTIRETPKTFATYWLS